MNAVPKQQRAIAEWFDTVYERKGARYLRPLHAYWVFLELLRARPEHRLLDVACGLGLLLRAAADYVNELHGIDISSVAVAAARTRLPQAQLAVGNAQRLPYPDRTFDLVTCLGSIERMLDREAALVEMLRVGTPRAKYCFLVRNSNTHSWKYFGGFIRQQRAAGHADANTLGNWTRLFETSGFRIVDVLPDQYPLHRARRWRSLFLAPVDYRQPIAARGPLERANEFVFLLEKQT